MDYEINVDTNAIIPLNNEKSYIMEPESEYYVSGSTTDVIEHSCEYFGSSYEGRSIGTYNLLGIQHKIPIIIEESSNIIFFPTASPRRNECFWLSYENITKFDKGNNAKSTIVEFKSGQKLMVPVSIHSFSNQYLRAGRLKAVISSRKLQK